MFLEQLETSLKRVIEFPGLKVDIINHRVNYLRIGKRVYIEQIIYRIVWLFIATCRNIMCDRKRSIRTYVLKALIAI